MNDAPADPATPPGAPSSRRRASTEGEQGIAPCVALTRGLQVDPLAGLSDTTARTLGSVAPYALTPATPAILLEAVLQGIPPPQQFTKPVSDKYRLSRAVASSCQFWARNWFTAAANRSSR